VLGVSRVGHFQKICRLILLILTLQEKFTVFYDNHDREQEQQHGLNDLAVWMCAKQLIEASCSDMKHNCDKDTPMGFIIQPIHQDHIWH
jgi:hypothetical protein